MFERLKKLFRELTAPDPDAPESIDNPRPKRPNHNPPQRDWFARVRERSLEARAEADTRALDRLDESEPRLSRETSRQADELLAKTLTRK